MKFILGRWIKMLYEFYSKCFLNSRDMGFCGKNVVIDPSVMIVGKHNLFMHDNTRLLGNSTILCTRAKFIIKKNSGAATGLTVVTGNHMSVVGRWTRDLTDEDKDRHPEGKNFDKDVIINEDVWIASNVTLLLGTTIGRGAIIGSGTVCRNNVPPYSIVIGNPAKVVGFKFTPNEIIEHEKSLYPEEERLSLDYLKKNYKEYYLDRYKEALKFSRL
jgi:acetyltransferase-like isoleucine patch superfamily enzyme